MALDASRGLVWFSKNGLWLEDGDPEAGLNPAIRLQEAVNDFEYMIPVIGVLPGCNRDITIRANFGSSPFTHERPPSFIPIKSDECTCTAAFGRCMKQLGMYCTQHASKECSIVVLLAVSKPSQFGRMLNKAGVVLDL